mmetsp:Transcript_9734/g.27272  ORF Transcript_9734/g.27272 Transcript_9734/m.27272 type:complete len:347 (-) Transcript_9734:130-1170(-)
MLRTSAATATATFLIFYLLALQLELVTAGAAGGSQRGARTASLPGAGTDEQLLSLERMEFLDDPSSSVFTIPDKTKSGTRQDRRKSKGRRKSAAASPEAEFKSNAEWWKDPLSHFDDKGNEITGNSKASKGRSNPLAIVVPALGKVATTIAQHPAIFAASAALILFSQLDENTHQQMLSGVRRFKDNMISFIRSRGNSRSTADEPFGSMEPSPPVAATKASRNASRSGIFGSKKKHKVDSENVQTEAEMRGLLARAISAEKEKQNAEQRYDILQSQLQTMKRQLDKVMSSNADLHAHLQATQKISADVQLLNDKIDKLAIYIGRQLQVNGGSNNGTGQRNIPRYGR